MEDRKILILGNGPSLKTEYFDLFESIETLGMNAAYRYWEKIGWYPTYYACLDDQVVLSHAQAILAMVREARCSRFFLHQNILKIHPELRDYPSVTFLCQLTFGPRNLSYCNEFGVPHTPDPYFHSQFPAKLTTGSYSVRFAASLGYNIIGLIGIDCRYTEIIPEASNIGGIALSIERTPSKNSNYFFDDYQQKGDVYNIPNPEVHRGNLHLQSFEAIKSDIVRYEMSICIQICTIESELYDKDVFKYTPIRSFLGHPVLSAVFVPFVSSDLAKLLERLKMWGRPGYTPRRLQHSSPPVGLHFAFNKGHDSKIEEAISAAFEDANLNRFFGSITFHYSNLDGLRDLYTRNFEGPFGPEGYMAGPNNQFFDIICKFSAGMSHIAVIEADVAPIRPGWLDAIESIVEGSERFWICGSHYRGVGRVQALWHVNGNSIYNVGDAGFTSFFKDKFLPYFYDRVKRVPSLAYDIVLFDMLKQLFDPKREDSVQFLWTECAHRIRFSEYIVDLSHADDRQDERLLSLSQAREKFPHSYLVHGAVEAIDRDINAEGPLAAHSVPARGERIVLIDPDARNYFGHFLAYDLRIAQSAGDRRIAVTVLGNKDFDSALLPTLPIEFLPVFSVNSWTIGHLKSMDEIPATRFREELEQGLDMLVANHGSKPTVIYMYTGSIEHAKIIGDAILNRPLMRANINLFYSYNRNEQAVEYILRWKEFVNKNAGSGKLKLTVPTTQLQKDYERAFGLLIPTAPHPSTTYSDDEARSLLRLKRHDVDAKPRILFPGGMRPEKGYALSVRAAKQLAEQNQGLCIVRALVTESVPKPMVELAETLAGTSVVVDGTDLNDIGFKKFLETGDIIVCPYLPYAFARRTSGLVIDAMLLGRPIVVINGTWLADLALSLNIGLAVDPDPVAIVDAVEEITSRYEEFGRSLWMARRLYFVDHSWRRLVDTILEPEWFPSPTSVHRATHAHSREQRISVDETEVIAQLLGARKGSKHVMLDIGAHVGTSAAFFDNLGWTIHCFEPDATNREKLEKRLGKNANVIIDGRAVGDKPAEGVPFFQSEESTGISGLHAFRDTHRESGTVDVTTIADVTGERRVRHVDFLKIDVEGFDFSVLQGVPWDRLKPDIIECEFEDHKTVPLGHTYKDVADFLRQQDYTIYLSEWHPIVRYGIRHDWQRLIRYPGPDLPSNAWGNILAFKQDPGFEAVAAAFEAVIRKKRPNFALDLRKELSDSAPLTEVEETQPALPEPEQHAAPPEAAPPAADEKDDRGSATVQPNSSAMPGAKIDPVAVIPSTATPAPRRGSSLKPPPIRLYTRVALWASAQNPLVFRLGQFGVWCLRTMRRQKLITFFFAVAVAGLVGVGIFASSQPWSTLFSVTAAVLVGIATLAATIGFAGHLVRRAEERSDQRMAVHERRMNAMNRQISSVDGLLRDSVRESQIDRDRLEQRFGAQLVAKVEERGREYARQLSNARGELSAAVARLASETERNDKRHGKDAADIRRLIDGLKTDIETQVAAAERAELGRISALTAQVVGLEGNLAERLHEYETLTDQRLSQMPEIDQIKLEMFDRIEAVEASLMERLGGAPEHLNQLEAGISERLAALEAGIDQKLGELPSHLESLSLKLSQRIAEIESFASETTAQIPDAIAQASDELRQRVQAVETVALEKLARDPTELNVLRDEFDRRLVDAERRSGEALARMPIELEGLREEFLRKVQDLQQLTHEKFGSAPAEFARLRDELNERLAALQASTAAQFGQTNSDMDRAKEELVQRLAELQVAASGQSDESPALVESIRHELSRRVQAVEGMKDEMDERIRGLQASISVQAGKVEPELQALKTELHQRVESVEKSAADKLAGLPAIQERTDVRLKQIEGLTRGASVYNISRFQKFNRTLRAVDIEKLVSDWSKPLGLDLNAARLGYLAHRACFLENQMKGRFATSIEAIVLRCLVASALKRNEISILEIGTLFGVGAAAVYEAAANEYDAVHLTVIDPLDGYYAEGNRDILTGAQISERTLRQNWSLAPIPAKDYTIIKHLSTASEALAEAAKRKYDLLIIDGDHTYEGVKFDFDNYAHLVRPGGFIIFDDYDVEDWPDIKRYVDTEISKLQSLYLTGAAFRTAVYQVKKSIVPKAGKARVKAAKGDES